MGFINVARRLEEWNMSYTYPNNTSFRFLWHLSIFLPDCSLWSEAGPWSLSLGNERLLTQLWLLKGRCMHALAGHLTIPKQVSGEPQSPFLSFQSWTVKLPLPMICIVSKTRAKPSSTPGALASPFSVMTCFDIKTRWFLEIQSLCSYLHLVKHCRLVPYPYLLQNKPLCASPGSSLKKGRRTEGSYSLADVGLSTKAFGSECHQQQMAPGDIAAITSGLQAATSSWIRLLCPTPSLSDLLA